MLTNARLPGMSNQSSFRKLFIFHLPSSRLCGCAHEIAKPLIEEGRRERRRELDYKLMKLNMMPRRPVNLELLPEYRDRVEEKLSRGGGSARWTLAERPDQK
jgi:hypothetical protein